MVLVALVKTSRSTSAEPLWRYTPTKIRNWMTVVSEDWRMRVHETPPVSLRVTSSSGLHVYCWIIVFHNARVGNIFSVLMYSSFPSSASDVDVMEGHDM